MSAHHALSWPTREALKHELRVKGRPSPPQQGAVLILALLILLVLTLLGISSIKSTLMSELMSGNLRDRNLAFQAAESGLRDASDWVLSLTTRPNADNSATNNIYAPSAYLLGDISSLSYDWDSNAIKLGTLNGTANQIGSCDPAPGTAPTELPGVRALPCFIIEEHAFVPDDLDPDTSAKGIGRYYYRTSSIGYGGTDSAKSVLQSLMFQRFN